MAHGGVAGRTCGMCCTAHQRQRSAGVCPPHAQHGGFSAPQRCRPFGTGVQDLRGSNNTRRVGACVSLASRIGVVEFPHILLPLQAVVGCSGVLCNHKQPVLCRPSCMHTQVCSPTIGAARSLYGRLYCTDRALGSGCGRGSAGTGRACQQHVHWTQLHLLLQLLRPKLLCDRCVLQPLLRSAVPREPLQEVDWQASRTRHVYVMCADQS